MIPKTVTLEREKLVNMIYLERERERKREGEREREREKGKDFT